MRPALKIGLIAALLVLGLDQASKMYLLFVHGLPANYPITLAPFLEFVPVWNRGISWGMFQQEGALGRWALTGFHFVAAIALTIWLTRTHGKMNALGLGLIIGGAIGNGIDRIFYGAVFDFIHFFTPWFDFEYVFNIADAAIVLGVPCLLYPEPRMDGPDAKTAASA
jgi:signal peptidase II